MNKLKCEKYTGDEALRDEFGARAVNLHTGAVGLRVGLHFEVKSPSNMPGMPDMPDGLPMMDFIGSDNSVDRYNEVVDQKGWLLDNFRKNPVIPDSHDYSSISKILGKAVFVDVVNGRLVNRVQFAVENPLGNLAYKMARGGFIKSQSVGFMPVEWQNGVGMDQPDRTFTKQELLEISLVAVPANPGATLGLALKSGAVARGDLRDVAEFLKFWNSQAAGPDNSPNTGSAGNDVRLLQLARDLKTILRRAK